jgi:two-component system, response regulator PdtaR
MMCSAKALAGKTSQQPVVLVVEDEILVRAPVADFLRTAGYKVVEAADAAEAVSIFVTGTEIDLVFSDIEMPGPMDGLALAGWISDHHPGVPVILTSGIARRVRGTRALFVPKPYRPAAVAHRISALLMGGQQVNA